MKLIDGRVGPLTMISSMTMMSLLPYILTVMECTISPSQSRRRTRESTEEIVVDVIVPVLDVLQLHNDLTIA